MFVAEYASNMLSYFGESQNKKCRFENVKIPPLRIR